MLDASVIIPTYNRNDLLIECLGHLERQSYKKDRFEVIVVDDGSTDGTKDAVKNYLKKSKLKLRLFSQKNRGPAAARNLAIRKAKGKIVLITNDDTYPSENWLKEHMRLHAKVEDIGVLGPVEWHNKMEVNEFMHFIAPYGPLFDFRIKNPNNCGFGHFFTSNISLDRKRLIKSKFNEKFKYASCEDIELGYRLEKNGLRILLNKNATVYHDHFIEDSISSSFYKKLYIIGNCYKDLEKLHPEKFKVTFFHLVKLMASRFYFLLSFDKKLYWRFKCGFFYHLGMFDGKKDIGIISEILYKIVKYSYNLPDSFKL